MLKRFTIKVLAKDIKRGKASSTDFCPIALAVKRLGFKKKVSVCNNLMIGDKCYNIPKRANTFIDDFDNGLKVKPFTFVAKECGW